MSVRSKSEKGIKDVMKEFYESWEKTAAEQLMKVARNQVFLSAIAQNIERTLNISGRVKEVTQTTMAMMSLPTKQDVDNLTKQIRLIRAALDEVNEKLDILTATGLSPVAAVNAAASMAATIAEVSDLGGFDPSDLNFEESTTKKAKPSKSPAPKSTTSSKATDNSKVTTTKSAASKSTGKASAPAEKLTVQPAEESTAPPTAKPATKTIVATKSTAKKAPAKTATKSARFAKKARSKSAKASQATTTPQPPRRKGLIRRKPAASKVE